MHFCCSFFDHVFRTFESQEYILILVINNFLFFFIEFIREIIKYNYVLFNYIFTVINCDLLALIRLLFDSIWITLRRFWCGNIFYYYLYFVFPRETFLHQSVSKRLKHSNNRLVQLQVNIVGATEKTNWFLQYFSVLFLLYVTSWRIG